MSSGKFFMVAVFFAMGVALLHLGGMPGYVLPEVVQGIGPVQLLRSRAAA